jgi:phospholipid/cholesterol/gamma-HCH transport system substrate-binding protein
LVKDEVLYNELIKSNKDLQNLIIDLETHPERYVNISLIGRKSKGLHLTVDDENKLHQILDSTSNINNTK